MRVPDFLLYFREYDNTFMTDLEKLLEGRETIDSGDIPLHSKNDLLANLSAVAYSDENGYIVETKEGYMEVGQMLLRNYTIRREKK